MAVKLDIEINFDSKRVLAFDRGLAGLELASQAFEKAFVRASKAVNSEAAKMNNSLLELLATTTMLGQEMAKIKFQPGAMPSLGGGGAGATGAGGRKARVKAEKDEAAESLAAQKEYYRRRNLAERQRAADARRNANDIARAERVALLASGQDRGGVGLTQMALAERGGVAGMVDVAGVANRVEKAGQKKSAARRVADKAAPVGLLASMGNMSQGGKLFQSTKFLADINALPFGYERYGVRMAKTAELGIKVFGMYGAKIVGVGTSALVTTRILFGLQGGIAQMAKDGDKDAQRLAEPFVRLGKSVSNAASTFGTDFVNAAHAVNTQLDRTVGKVLQVTGVIKALAETSGFIGDIGTLMLGESSLDQPALRGSGRVFDGRRMANQSAEQRAKARADRKREKELGGLTDKGDIEEQIRNARQQEVFANAELAGMKKPKKPEDASPEYRAAEDRKKAIEAEIIRLESRRDELDSEAAEKALEASRKRADILIETRKSLVAVRAEMAGTVFDPDAVMGLDAVNASLEQQVSELTTLSEEFRLTEEDRAARLEKINGLLARQKQEQRFLVEMDQARSEFAAKMADSSLAAKGEATDRAFNPAREAEAFAKSNVNMLQQRGLISERQANEGRRMLAQSDLETKALEEQFKIERERLELARKKAEQDKKAAKSAQDEQKARQELLKAEQALAEQGLSQDRRRAEVQERRTAAMREQAQLEAQQRIDRQADIAQQVQDQRTGAVQQQMQQRGPNQARIQQQQFTDRLGTALAERQKKEGRKLNRREQMEVYNEQLHGRQLSGRERQKLVAEEEKRSGRKLTRREREELIQSNTPQGFIRDVNGPTAADQRREAGRQRGDEREALRWQNRQNRGLPPGMAAANNRLAAQNAQDQEGRRQADMQSGAFGQAMNVGNAAEAAQAAGSIATQQVQLMQQLGLINEAQAEAMQNQINVNTALMQSNAQLQAMLQSVNAVLAGQQQAVQNNQQRKRAQRSGGAN